MEEKYNGWTNYPTWATDVWLTGEYATYKYWHYRSEDIKKEYPTDTKYHFADEIKDLMENELDTKADNMPGWIRDILYYAFQKINFYEIAEDFLED